MRFFEQKKSHVGQPFLTFIFIALSILLNLFVTQPKAFTLSHNLYICGSSNPPLLLVSPQLHRMIYHGLLSLVNQNHFLAFCTFYELTLINTVLVLSISTSKNIGTSNVTQVQFYFWNKSLYHVHLWIPDSFM